MDFRFQAHPNLIQSHKFGLGHTGINKIVDERAGCVGGV